MKLLAVCDSPILETGFARVAQNLLSRWARHFEAVDVWAIGYSGHPPRSGGKTMWVEPPFRLFPAFIKGPWYTAENLQNLANFILEGDYTHIWILQDHFGLAGFKFPAALRECSQKIGAKVFYYCPVDGEMETEWGSIVEACDVTVAYTDYGRQEIVKQIGELNPIGVMDRFGPTVRVLPHGVDAGIYRPLTGGIEQEVTEGTEGEEGKDKGSRLKAEGKDRRDTGGMANSQSTDSQEVKRPEGRAPYRMKLRAEVSEGWIQPDDIVLINVNAHQRRKDVGRSLQILAELKRLSAEWEIKREEREEREAPRFKLIMHMPRSGPPEEQSSLMVMGRQLGLVQGNHGDWDCTDDGQNFTHGWHAALPQETLNKLYNVADLYLTTSLGEGWGLGIVEAASAGCVVAVPEHTACREIANVMRARGMADKVVTLPVEKHAVWLPLDNCRARRRVEVEGAAARIFQWAVGRNEQEKTEGTERTGLSPGVREWLDWDRIAECWVDLFFGDGTDGPEVTDGRDVKRPEGRAPNAYDAPRKRGTHYYLEYGGGLGDVFNGMYLRGSYNILRDLKDDETATVALVCHNPFAGELFQEHPKVKSGQVQVIETGYWDGREDAKMRAKWCLPTPGGLWRLPDRSKTLDGSGLMFYPLDTDRVALRDLWTCNLTTRREGKGIKREDRKEREGEGLVNQAPRYVVLAPGAGTPERNIPENLLAKIVARVLEAGLTVVWVGRDYKRFDRIEPGLTGTETVLSPAGETPALRSGWNVWDYRNKLSVPGAALLLSGAAGLVTCHSALNILGWYMRIPQLLLYPESVRQRHFLKQDQWSWGAYTGGTAGMTKHGVFGEFRDEWVEEFVEMTKGQALMMR
jgi:glycosyltransferase involved in cell wall biosynthesis